jgi:hypothetical protein
MPPPAEPMIKLEPGGTAPILSYNVPEPTSYSGRHVVELDIDADWFTPEALKVPPPPPPPPTPGTPPIVVRSPVGVLEEMMDRETVATAMMAEAAPSGLPRPIVAMGASAVLKALDPDDAIAKVNAGYRLVRYKDFGGNPAVRALPPIPKEPRPRLLLVEVYELVSYLGAYGAGRVIKTFTLLPGEKTKISVKSYTKSVTDSKSASSILDSYTTESADDFESSLSSEQSDKRSETENFEYHAEAEASASWGWGSAKVSGGVKGGTSSAREEFAKNVSNAAQKHSAKASAKREVQVNTSYEVKEETGEETSVERTIENVNLSRVLNFVFRQMNQQFTTVLKLTDVRVAFFNGFQAMAREVALPQLDTLLETYIVPTRHAEVRAALTTQIQDIRDYDDNPHPFIEEVALAPTDKYLRVKRDLEFAYTVPITESVIRFTGVPLAVNTYTMRTEGVIVEALLGQASSLDGYAERLQELEVQRRTAEVSKLAAEASRVGLINTIAQEKDFDAAKALAELTCPCGHCKCTAETEAPSPAPADT